MRCLLFLVFFSAVFAGISSTVQEQRVVIVNLTTEILDGAKNGAAYASIHNNNSYAVTLYKVEVSPEVFNKVELHDCVERTDSAGGKYIETIEVPAMEIAPGQTLFLSPGSKHLMLMDIKPTYCGEKTLTFNFYFHWNSGKDFVIKHEAPIVKDSQRCSG